MIAIILGTRPDIIKMSSITQECEARDLNNFSSISGQHCSYYIDAFSRNSASLTQNDVLAFHPALYGQ